VKTGLAVVTAETTGATAVEVTAQPGQGVTVTVVALPGQVGQAMTVVTGTVTVGTVTVPGSIPHGTVNV